MTLFADRTHLLDTENAFKIGPQIAKIESQGHKVVKLNLGEPDFDIPQFIKEEIKKRIDENLTHYCDPSGILPLREAIANQLSETRGISITADKVVVFPGAKPSIGFTQEAYVNPGEEVIYPSPGFPIYESFIRYIGAVPKPLLLKERNDFSFSAEELEPLITPQTKMIILNFPSNPTGGVATQQQLEAIAEVIQKKCSSDVRIYSDEIYEYVIFDGKKNFSIASVPGMQSRTIISSGFSKTFAWTGGRIGFAAFPTVEEAQVFRNLNINYFSCIPAYNQHGARIAYEHPDRDKAIRGMVDTFQERRDFIVEKLNAIPGFRCLKPGGAFYVFPNIEGACESLGVLELMRSLPADKQKRTSPSTLFQNFALYEHKIATMDRRSFGKIGSESQHYLRLSYAANLDELALGVSRLKDAASDSVGFKRFYEKHPELI